MLSLFDSDNEGQSDNHPIFPHQTIRMEFDSLLEYFYFRCVPVTCVRYCDANHISPHTQKRSYKPTEDDWAAIPLSPSVS
jgi:hypothetical protein